MTHKTFTLREHNTRALAAIRAHEAEQARIAAARVTLEAQGQLCLLAWIEKDQHREARAMFFRGGGL